MVKVAEVALPTHILHNDFFQEPQFVLGKQYAYGLHLISNDPQVLAQLQRILADWNAPAWPSVGTSASMKEQLRCWTSEASHQANCNPLWWRWLEVSALQALARNPGMDLGVFTKLEQVRDLDVVKCGAANRELYAENDSKDDQGSLSSAILNGRSLRLLQADGQQGTIDPIGRIMAAAVSEKGHFGNEIRHLFFMARVITPRTIMAAQALTSKMTQAVLSVKSAGKEVPSFEEYKARLRYRWLGEPEAPSSENEKLSEIFQVAKSSGVVSELDDAFSVEYGADGECRSHHEPLLWQKWFFAPHDLPSLLHPTAKDGIKSVEILVPLDDLRVRPWLASD